MTEIEARREIESLEGSLTEAEFDQLETRLTVRAGSLGWTGDPLRQPATAVLAEIQAVLAARGTAQ